MGTSLGRALDQSKRARQHAWRFKGAKKMKSVLAVVAGFVFTVVVTLALDVVMYNIGMFSRNAVGVTTGAWLIAVLYRFVVGTAGSWITAKFAPRRPLFHALIGGAIGTALGLIGLVMAMIKGPEMGPLWYAFAVLVTILPASWIGGSLVKEEMGTLPIS
jgi:hypothetical protein